MSWVRLPLPKCCLCPAPSFAYKSTFAFRGAPKPLAVWKYPDSWIIKCSNKVFNRVFNALMCLSLPFHKCKIKYWPKSMRSWPCHLCSHMGPPCSEGSCIWLKVLLLTSRNSLKFLNKGTCILMVHWANFIVGSDCEFYCGICGKSFFGVYQHYSVRKIRVNVYQIKSCHTSWSLTI